MSQVGDNLLSALESKISSSTLLMICGSNFLLDEFINLNRN